MPPSSTVANDPQLSPAGSPFKRCWTVFGLIIGLFAGPLVVGAFTYLSIPWNPVNVTLRELTIFGWVAVLAYIIRRKERLGWDSVGLQRPSIANTALWVLIMVPGAALTLFLAVAISQGLGFPIGHGADAAKFELLPTWVITLVVLRAGFVEEFFYRGYVIDRLQRLTGNRVLAVALPLVLFALVHYRQGWAGVIISFMMGALLTAVYLYKRNLWIGIITHFLVDFVLNVISPLFMKNGH
jgi:membrane protease YdiL (CAAX protease family)